MNDEPDPDPELRRALEALPPEIPPSAGLETRTLAALRRAGLLSPRPGAFGVWSLRIAAAAALLGIGYLWGASADRTAAPGGERYLLLLQEDQDFRIPPSGEQGLVAEYRDWATLLRRQGALLGGEELDPRRVQLPGLDGASGSGGAEVAGFFIIVAPNDTRARAIAETCPHLRHGGRIEVRRIRPT